MDKKWFLLISLLFLFGSLCAQIQLKGRVLDAKTQEPIVAANVYLDGTTLGAATDKNGRFSVVLEKPVYTNLIIRYIGYESVVIADPYKKLPEVIYLEPKEKELDEVVVVGKPLFSRAQKLRAFRKIFFGNTQAGRSCKILNEDDIKLVYDKDRKTLSAFADRPIEIENGYLKYKLEWELISFDVVYKKTQTLNQEKVELISFYGTASFQDMAPNDVSVAQRREKVYQFSSRRFFNLLAKEDINASDFKMSGVDDHGFMMRADSIFIVSPDTLLPSCKKIEFKEQADEFRDRNGVHLEVKNINLQKIPRSTVGDVKMYYNSKNYICYYKLNYVSRSKISFLTNSFYVDSYGNTDLLDRVLMNGFMGKRRVGDLLPLDYMPSDRFEEDVRKRNVDSIGEDMIFVFDSQWQQVAVYLNDENSPL